MKRFTKISLILSGGFLLLGIVLCLTAYTMGGRVGDLSVSYDSEKHSFVTGDQIKVTEGEEQHFQNIENLDLNMAWASSRSAMDPVRISCSAPSEPANSSASRMERP